MYSFLIWMKWLASNHYRNRVGNFISSSNAAKKPPCESLRKIEHSKQVPHTETRERRRRHSYVDTHSRTISTKAINNCIVIWINNKSSEFLFTLFFFQFLLRLMTDDRLFYIRLKKVYTLSAHIIDDDIAWRELNDCVVWRLVRQTFLWSHWMSHPLVAALRLFMTKQSNNNCLWYVHLCEQVYEGHSEKCTLVYTVDYLNFNKILEGDTHLVMFSSHMNL